MNKKDLEKLGFTVEMLKKAELPDDVLDKAIILHGKGIESHKAKIITLETERDDLKTQLTDANKAIEGFKKLDPDSIQKAADDWKAKAEIAEQEAKDTKTEADAKIADMRFNQTLAEALKEAKVKDPIDIIPHLKRDMLKLGEDGKFVGLAEQLEPLMKSKDYLFSTDKAIPKIVDQTNNQSIIGDTVVDAAMRAAGLDVSKGK